MCFFYELSFKYCHPFIQFMFNNITFLSVSFLFTHSSYNSFIITNTTQNKRTIQEQLPIHIYSTSNNQHYTPILHPPSSILHPLILSENTTKNMPNDPESEKNSPWITPTICSTPQRRNYNGMYCMFTMCVWLFKWKNRH